MSRKAHVVAVYTQAGLAREAGVSRHAVAKAIERGLLATVPTLDGVAVVAQAEAERWLRERRTTPGRPRKEGAGE